MSEESQVLTAGDTIEDKTTINADGDTVKSTVITFTEEGGDETTLTSDADGINEAADKIKENGYLNKDDFTVTVRYDGATVTGLDYKQRKT